MATRPGGRRPAAARPARHRRPGHRRPGAWPTTTASTGAWRERPWLEATIPTLLDPTLAPAGTHVMSVIVQCAPARLREGSWATERDVLGDRVLAVLEAVAPGIGERVVVPAGHHAGGPGARLRPHRRAPAARRTRPRPVVRLAAAGRPGPLPAPPARPLPGRLRGAPGGRRHRRPRRERGARDPGGRPPPLIRRWFSAGPSGRRGAGSPGRARAAGPSASGCARSRAGLPPPPA